MSIPTQRVRVRATGEEIVLNVVDVDPDLHEDASVPPTPPARAKAEAEKPKATKRGAA